MKKDYISSTQIYLSPLHCMTCGEIMQIPRTKSEKREHAHIKTMFCPTCQRETDFVETKNGTAEEFESAVAYINHRAKIKELRKQKRKKVITA